MPTKRMLIDAAHPEETRVAIVEDERLLDHDVEVASRRQLKGNIYLAKVTRVEPSLQAAFVDYGGNRHGFLAFSEIHPDYYQIPVADREKLLAEQQAAEAVEHDGDEERSEDGNGVDEDELETRRPRVSSRHYKIQEVTKRRQIMLVQVVKEERGSKGAALTTYLSLAGRYCVLMPNTTRGGGISRKITSGNDRKRLKKIIGELEVPDGMAVILRTAGAERSKAEIKRDYEYLMRMWSTIRELTLKSMAPTLVYEEGNLIKRSIRDLYDRTTEEILIEGDAAYRTAKDFMKLFIPSHAKRVKLYEDPRWPLFQRYNVEAELEAMHEMTVGLKSGGSIVINPTEALVSIDVNSGRATRERHIEETALRTNLEACDEVARQLRLRDLAGLIVIDFIDMEVTRNQGQVERRLREAMKNDRARVQFGRISAFGLLELSRQRLRPSLWESSYEICPMCSGSGVRRSTESAALSVLRRIEAEGVKDSVARITVTAPSSVALYLLNQKRRALLRLEERYSVGIRILAAHDSAGTVFDVEIRTADEEEALAAVTPAEPAKAVAAAPAAEAESESEAAAEDEDIDGTSEEKEDAARRGRRRRPRRRKRTEDETPASAAEAGASDAGGAEAGEANDDEEAAAEAAGDAAPADEESAEAEAARKRRRRGKRGGRRRARRTGDEPTVAEEARTAAEGLLGDDGLPAPGTLLAPPMAAPEEVTAPATPESIIYVTSAAVAEVVAQEPEPEPEPEPAADAAAEPEPAADTAAEPEPAADTQPMPLSDLDVEEPATEATVTAPAERPAESREPALTDVDVDAIGRDERDDHGSNKETAGSETDPRASRGVVVNVGDGEGDDDGRRRGWWQRFLT